MTQETFKSAIMNLVSPTPVNRQSGCHGSLYPDTRDLLLVDALAEVDGSSGADLTAEVTAHTLLADDARLAGFAVEDDSLMTSVVARYLATSAAHAALAVDDGVDDGVAVEGTRMCEYGNALAYEVCEVVNAPLRHVAPESEYEVVDDAVAKLHDGRTHLYVAASQLDELQRVTPRLDAADAAEVGIAEDVGRGHFQDVPQGDGLDGAT